MRKTLASSFAKTVLFLSSLRLFGSFLNTGPTPGDHSKMGAGQPIAGFEWSQQQALATLRQSSETTEPIYHVVQTFLQIDRTRTGEQLDSWMSVVRACLIRELSSFVAGLERDKAAVLAGLTLFHSNGPTEGHITKLKLIKRMMYGRAKFPLLRQRMLHAV